MTRPIIGIVASFSDRGPGLPAVQINLFYVNAVLAAGGVPVLLPMTDDGEVMEQYIDAADGVLFCGGWDLSPARYGVADVHPKSKCLVGPLEDYLLEMFRRVDARGDVPAMGVCLGCQLFAVGRGGTLHQHVPDVKRERPLEHFVPQDPYLGSKREHWVSVTPESRVAEAIGTDRLVTNSSHHQSVADTGRDLVVTAMSDDGIVEAVEDPGREFFFAVQWHPEEIVDRPEHLALFRSLVQAAGRRQAARQGMAAI